ncbi:MAG: O-antigen ligase family protein [Patescibacteria group bacterium]
MEPKKAISKSLINAKVVEEKKIISNPIASDPLTTKPLVSAKAMKQEKITSNPLTTDLTTKPLSLKPSISIRMLDAIIGVVLILIFFLCPLFFTGLVAQTVGFEKIILFYFLVLFGTVIWVTKGIINGELKLKRTPIDLPILALLATFIISTILSVSPKTSLIGSYGNTSKSLIAVIVYILFYYLLINNINVKRIKLIFWSIIVSSSLIVVYSLLQLFGVFILPFAFTKFINFNPIGSIGALTGFLTIVLPLFIVSAGQIKEIHPNLRNKIVHIIIKSVLIILSFSVLTALTLLNGFTFWPAVIVGVVVLLMFFLSKVVKIFRSNIIMPIVIFAILIIFFVLGNFNIINFNLPTEVSLSRSVSWQIAKDSIIKKPFFGSGPSTFDYTFSRYKNIDFNNSPLWNVDFNNPSGILFELMANVGGLGILIFIIIALIALSISFISLIKNSANELQSVMLALFSSFISIIILALLFELNSSMILISIIISILSIAVSIVEYPEKFKSIFLTFRASPKYALALAVIFLTVSAGVVIFFTLGVKIYLADFYAMKAVKAANVDQKINYLNKAIRSASYRDVYYIALANSYMDKANQEAKNGKNQTIIRDSLSLAIENGKKAVEINPNSVANNEALAI